MIRILAPFICIVAAIIIFLGPTRTALREAEPLIAERADLEEALANAQRIQTVREDLTKTYNSYSAAELGRLQKMLPSHVDNVRLVIDIDSIATNYGMTLKDIEVEQTVDPIESPGVASLSGDGAEHLDLRFVVNGTYDALQLFLADLGKSLRLVDVTDLSFAAKDADAYDFSVGLRTYWLQDK